MTPKEYNRKQIEEGKLTTEGVDYLLELGVKQFQFETNAGLKVDGLAGPKTLEVLNGVLNVLDTKVPLILPNTKRGLGYYPTGKGIYIRSLRHCGTPEQMIERCKFAGFNFVVIGSIWQDRMLGIKRTTIFNSDADLEKYSKAFHDAGVEVWVWGYPYPGREDQFVDELIRHALLTKAVGVILDPEKPYKKKAAYANVLIQKLVPELQHNNLALGVTSYGSVKYFRDFPYKEFAQLAGTFGSPQVYDKDNNLPLTHAHEAFNGYKEAGFTEIVMSGPAFNKTPQQLRRLLLSYPTGTRAVIFWDWANLKVFRSLWNEIRDYKL